MQLNQQWEEGGQGQGRGGRRFSVSSDREALHSPGAGGLLRFPGTSEDLHAWSIYRQVSAHNSQYFLVN